MSLTYFLLIIINITFISFVFFNIFNIFSFYFNLALSKLDQKNFYLIIQLLVLKEYLAFLVYLGVCFLFSFLFFKVAEKINKKKFYSDKVSSYECGFEPFSDARAQVNIHFYIIALLFVIFDVEIIYFLPWAINFYTLGWHGFFVMFLFNFFLISAFVYEWSKGVFDWSKRYYSLEKKIKAAKLEKDNDFYLQSFLKKK